MLYQHLKTISSGTCDIPEWHRGREDYSVWLIELGNGEILKKVHAAREHLSEFVIRPYERQPHITIFVCGFLSDTLRYDDDYSPEQFRHHVHLLREAAVRPFTVEIGGLNSFASAPFLEVYDREGGLDRVRGLLLATGKEIARSTYVPHVTVGLYSGAFSTGIVSERLASFPKDPCRLRVDRITFASYRARELAGILTRRHELALSK
jgi:2'-5' RNA ligase